MTAYRMTANDHDTPADCATPRDLPLGAFGIHVPVGMD